MSLQNNHDALRSALQTQLSDVLTDLGMEGQANCAIDSRPNVTAVRYPRYSTNSGLPTSAFDFRPHSSRHHPASMAHSLMPRIPQAAFGAGARDAMDDTRFSAIAAAASERSKMFDHAKISFIQQQIAEEKKKLLIQQSYLEMLKMATSEDREPPQEVQFTSPRKAPATADASSSVDGVALEALGTAPRSKRDPYMDVSDLGDPKDRIPRRTRGGVSEPFPEKLHRMLSEADQNGLADVVSFFSHGRAICVHDVDRFVSEVMPLYFKQNKWNSFARQLNLYGFIRITSGPDTGGYYHELFLRDRPTLCLHMRRVGVPKGEDRRKFRPKGRGVEPDFYSMKRVANNNDTTTLQR